MSNALTDKNRTLITTLVAFRRHQGSIVVGIEFGVLWLSCTRPVNRGDKISLDDVVHSCHDQGGFVGIVDHVVCNGNSVGIPNTDTTKQRFGLDCEDGQSTRLTRKSSHRRTNMNRCKLVEKNSSRRGCTSGYLRVCPHRQHRRTDRSQ